MFSLGTSSINGPIMVAWISFWYRFRRALSVLYEWAGYPIIVRRGEYESSLAEKRISVKAVGLYTIISIKPLEGPGEILDLYFTRTLGRWDGVGIGAIGDCRLDPVPFSTEPPVPDAPAR